MMLINRYYGHNKKNITPINKEFSFVKNQRHLYSLLSKCWCLETCAPRMRKDWHKKNMTLGQCSITAFLVQDIFGGEVFAVKLPNGDMHCYNKVGDIVFDLTSEQFGKTKLEYKLENPQSRDTHFKDFEKQKRYLLLRQKLLNKNTKN